MRLLSPSFIGGTLLAVVAVGAAIGLGFWQLDVWEAERTAQARDLTRLEPVPLTDVMGPDDSFPAPDTGRPVTVQGTWIDGGFWVRDRENDGKDGFWAVSPFSVGGEGEPAVLVVRGWSESTDVDPDGTPPTGDAELTGWLQPSEGSMAVDDDPDDDVFPEVRVSDAVQRVDVDLYSGFVVLHEEQLEALPEANRSTGLQNFLYAVEWFLFAAFASYIWLRWVADLRGAHRAALEAAAPEGGDPGTDGPEAADGTVDGDQPDAVVDDRV